MPTVVYSEASNITREMIQEARKNLTSMREYFSGHYQIFQCSNLALKI